MKPVIGSTASLQKYNPEIEIPTKSTHLGGNESDKRILKLSDRLKNMRQVSFSIIFEYKYKIKFVIFERFYFF